MSKTEIKRRRLTPEERRLVYDKTGGCCAYCGEELEYENFQVDHLVSLQNGGADELDNMLPACRSCNHYKRGNSLEGWRRMLEGITKTLERDSYTYRQAVKFGQVVPMPRKIVFFFEWLRNEEIQRQHMIESEAIKQWGEKLSH